MNELLITLVVLNLILSTYLILKLQSPSDNDLTEQIRDLLSKELKENRTELTSSIKDNREEMAKGIDNLTSKLEEKLIAISETIKLNAKEDREQLTNFIKGFQ